MTNTVPVQMSLDWAATRARRKDPATSHKAALNAALPVTEQRRQAIVAALRKHGPMTARAISGVTGIDYYEVQRRMSECAGIRRTGLEVDGGAQWEAMAS